MTLGFFLVVRADVQHFLHAASLVREAKRLLPGVPIAQCTDQHSAVVPGVDQVRRMEAVGRPLHDTRLAHYAECEGDWLLVDTDVSIRGDVRHVFTDTRFDVALTDRHWPHLPQGEALLHDQPFNIGVVFSRCQAFWVEVLAQWRSYGPRAHEDWMSDQRAVYAVVRSGAFRVKILDGQSYNYPPTGADVPSTALLAHYKGPRKGELTKHATQMMSTPW